MRRWSGAGEVSGRKLGRPVLVTLTLAAATAFVLIASACGSSSSEGVAAAGTTETTTSTTPDSPDDSRSGDPTAFSACMRENGIGKFPDPEADGSISFDPGTSGIDVDSPQFQAAEKACAKLMPRGETVSREEQAKRLREMLAYSACIREQGMPSFPDPKQSVDGSIEMDTSGIDPRSPRFRAAQVACRELGLRGPGIGDVMRRSRG
jgi:hypothetical protein